MNNINVDIINKTVAVSMDDDRELALATAAAVSAKSDAEDAKDAAEAAAALTELQAFWFDSVADMKASGIPAGNTAGTKGYYTPNDGGSGMYTIRTKTEEEEDDPSFTDDGGSIIILNNGNVAELITDGTVNVKQFGAKADNTTDDASKFSATMTYANSKNFIPIVPTGTYKVTSTISGTFASFGTVTINGGGTVTIVDLQDVAEDAQDSADAAAASEANALAYKNAANTSATNAATSETNAQNLYNAFIAAYGYPLTAQTAASMTDTTKIYVYTGSETGYTFGDWYYHNGTAWTDGGVYNAIAFNTDPTLSIEGAAADAQVVGDKINDIESDLTQLETNRIIIESGKYDEANSGQKKDSVARLRNSFLIPTKDISYIKVPDEYAFQLHLFDANGNWLSYSSTWVKFADKTYFGSASYIGLTIENTSTPNADISGQAATVSSGIVLYTDAETINKTIGLNIIIESGKYDEANSGQKKDSVARLRNRFLLPLSVFQFLTLPSGYSMQVHYFDSAMAWLGYDSTWENTFSAENVANGVAYIGMTVRNDSTPNDNISSQAGAVSSGITITLLAKEFVRSDTYNQLFGYDAVFESGKYDETNNGTKKASVARIRNSDLIPLQYVKSIYLPSGYDAQIHRYNSLKAWVGYDPDWKTFFDVAHVAQNVKYIGLTIRKKASPNADITADISIVKNGTIFVTVLENHADVNDVYEDVVENLKQVQRTKNISKDNYLTRNKPLVLFHFSDIHQEQGNLRDIVDFAKANSGLIDDTICTGDIVGARFQNGMAWFDNVDGAEKILLTIGNHDVMNASSGYDDNQTATLEEIYAQFIEPYYSNWGLTSDPSSGVTYYYKDYTDSKVRLIVIDCMLDNVDADADAVQIAWFINTLADAITNGFYVVVANHCFPNGATFVTSNWTNADYHNTQTYLDSRYPEAVDDFIGNGGHFVCWIEGHSHADYYMRYDGTHGSQMAISVDAACRSQAEPFTDVNRLENDRSYNSANLVCIDTGAEVVKVIKFGAKCNYKLIPRNTLTLGFDGSIISQS